MRNPIKRIRAFSLVEVTLALGVASFALTAIFGLLPLGLMLSRGAIDQTAASGILSVIAADLRSASPTATKSAQFGITIPANATTAGGEMQLFFGDDGEFTTAAASDSRFRMSLSFLPGDHPKAPLKAAIQLGWPAAVEPSQATGKVEALVTIDRNL